MHELDRHRRFLAVALAALAGFVDSTGFLSGAGYFVSFMSGNTTRLAVNLADDPALALAPGLLILGFFCGVFAGALLGYAAGKRRQPVVMAAVTVLLLVVAIAGNLGAPRLAMVTMVLAMGAVNNVLQRDGAAAIGVTYMTGALVRAAQALAARVAGRPGAGWSNDVLLWSGLAAGGIAGAAAWQRFGAGIEWFAVLWSAALTALVVRWRAVS